MKKHLDDIACRRRLILEKIRAQKRDIAEISLQLQKPLALVDAGIKAVHFIRSHPTLVTGGVAMLLALRRGDFVGMKQHGWRLLCLYPATSRLTRHFSRQKRNTEFD
ncbi:MAG: YqjK family protein [Gallionella sp.]|nr:YqjK family protein [Gallionella sp.]